jgi:glutathione reductase (NADPH)
LTAFDFDLLVIGGGSAGVRAARISAELGARVALIEASKLGGTCVNAGCVPKKLLFYAAEFAHAFDDAKGFGWSVGPRSFDWRVLIEQKDLEIKRLNAVYQAALERAGVELVNGRARLVDGHRVEVNGTQISSRYLLVATGGFARVPYFEGSEHAITSDDAFHLSRLPARVAIVGSGYIALEFACIFHHLGAQVDVVHRGPRILSSFDHDASEHLASELGKQGVTLRASLNVTRARQVGAELNVELTDGATIRCDQLMLAIGRGPRTRDLGLEQAGVQLAPGGALTIDDLGQSSVESVFAAGDCTGGDALTPVAIAQGQAIARTLFGGQGPVRVDRTQIPTAVFSQPMLATVGLTEHEARERGHELEIFRSSFKPLKHTLSGRDARSLVKVIVDRQSQRVLGCHMVGSDAPEIIQGLAVAMRCSVTKAQLDSTIGIHPTAAEEFVTLK